MTAERIVRNSLFLGSSKILAKVLTTVFTLAIARWSGTEMFGVYSAVLTYIAFFGIIEEFGLTVPMIRKIAKKEKAPAEYISEVFGVKLMLAVPAFILFVLFALFLKLDPVVSVLFGISMVLETLNVSFVRAFEGVESMERIAVITVAERFVFGLFGAIAIMTDGGLVMLAAAHVGAALVLSVMSTAAWGRMQQRIRTAADAGTLKRLLRESMPFAVASVFSIGYTRIDLVILSLMGSASDVGVYSASFRITEAMVFIPTAIVASIFPVLARAHAAGAGFEFLFGKYFAVLSAAGVLLGAVVFGLAEPIVLILFGGGYTGSIEVLRILCLMVPFTFMNAFIGTALIAVNKEKLSTGAIIFCALFNGTVNSFAIPYFGFIGAAATKVGTEIAGVIFQVIMLHRSTSYKGLYTQWIVRSTPN